MNKLVFMPANGNIYSFFKLVVWDINWVDHVSTYFSVNIFKTIQASNLFSGEILLPELRVGARE